MRLPLWIAGRYLQGISFVIAPLGMKRTVNYPAVLRVLFFVSAFLVLSIFPLGIFQDCYLEGVGLTPFKILSEYVISSSLLLAILLLLWRRRDFDPRVLRFLCISLVLTVLSELAFTLLRVDGNDVHSAVRVSFDRAMLGTVATVSTIDGKAEVKVPPGTASGKKLRLRGKGMPDRSGGAGDHYITVQIDVPAATDDETKKLLIQLATRLRKRGQED